MKLFSFVWTRIKQVEKPWRRLSRALKTWWRRWESCRQQPGDTFMLLSLTIICFSVFFRCGSQIRWTTLKVYSWDVALMAFLANARGEKKQWNEKSRLVSDAPCPLYTVCALSFNSASWTRLLNNAYVATIKYLLDVIQLSDILDAIIVVMYRFYTVTLTQIKDTAYI